MSTATEPRTIAGPDDRDTRYWFPVTFGGRDHIIDRRHTTRLIIS